MWYLENVVPQNPISHLNGKIDQGTKLFPFFKMDGPNLNFLNLRVSDQIELILTIKFEIFKKFLSKKSLKF